MNKFVRNMTILAVTTFAAMPAFAQEAAASAGGDKGLKFLAAAIAIGLAALGGALAQGRAASSALEGIARNPAATDKIQTPMIVGLALIESLVIYALVISLKLAEFF